MRVSDADQLNDAVRAELEKILESSDFDASERNRRFLNYIVTETLAGRTDGIKGYTIATEVFGRAPSFDPQTDPIVRIEARRLRRALERYYLMSGRNAGIRIVVPKGSYVPSFEAAGDTIHEDPTSPGPAIAPPPKHRGPSIFVAAFEAEGDQSIFPNFTNGFTRQIIVALTRFTELTVFGPDTTWQVGSQADRQRLRSELGADLLLLGGVALSGDRISVEALLADLKSGQTVWAESYDRGLTPGSIISVRDDVANSIARTLAQPYGVVFQRKAKEIEAAPPASLRAYACVVEFFNYWRAATKSARETVRRCLEEAILREPGYADPYACLSMVYSDDFRFDVGSASGNPATLERARALAEKALDLAPASSHAYHALALALWFAQDVEASLEAYEAALALNPNNTDVMANLGLRHAVRMNWDRAAELLRESYRRNPAQPTGYRMGLAVWHYAHGRFAEALAEARKVNVPDVLYGHLLLAISAAEAGRHDEAHAAAGRLLSLDPGYADHAEADLARRNVHPDLIRSVLQSLGKAGLKIPPMADAR